MSENIVLVSITDNEKESVETYVVYKNKLDIFINSVKNNPKIYGRYITVCLNEMIDYPDGSIRKGKYIRNINI
jgi:hypothetical protein